MNNLLAAFVFFTRLPFWRLKELPRDSFTHVVAYWPLTGWLTGGTTVAVLWLAGQIFPASVAWLFAITARLLLTGCLHEDGLADFFDGMGGGHTRGQKLAIMKDSRTGSYGVTGLAVYFLLLFQFHALPLHLLCPLAFCADCWSKAVASQLVNLLPYARSEEESKAHVVYRRMNVGELLAVLAGGLLPLACLLPLRLWPAALFPVAVFVLLCRLLKRWLGGYTGDCCGAVFLLCELAFYLGSLCTYR